MLKWQGRVATAKPDPYKQVRIDQQADSVIARSPARRDDEAIQLDRHSAASRTIRAPRDDNHSEDAPQL